MSSQQNFLESSRKLFTYYKELTDKTLSQITSEDFFWKQNEESNSIAIILKHLSGNMLSRWHEFRTQDGEKEWRNRDYEFVLSGENMADYLDIWEKAWTVLWREFDELDESNMMDIVYIRNEGHTIIEAIQRQITHLSYHVGQIIYIGKMQKSDQWKSLSIPKNQSDQFNEERFDKEKSKTHFTDTL